MARTAKTEWSKPDGFHLTNRIARKARPAGRLIRLIEAELADAPLPPKILETSPL